MPSTLAGPILRESERTTQHIDEAMVQWSADTLRQILEAELPDTQVIVVSNREPYIHERVDGEIAVQCRPAAW